MTGADSIAMNQALVSLGELVGNGKFYRVPRFQRDYAWGSEEWGDLWDDIIALENGESGEFGQHYMGYIVLEPKRDSQSYALIIDGQQRIATMSILASAILRRIDDLIETGIEPQENQQRRESLERFFLGDKDIVSLTYRPRLHLNRYSDDFYRDHILPYKRPKDMQTRRLPERKMWQAIEFFYGELKKKFPLQAGEGAAAAAFAEGILLNRLIFTVIRISDELNAYQVFETLNSRGAELSPADLVKNLLFEKAENLSKENLAEMERSWDVLGDRLQRGAMTELLRHHWNSKYPLVRKRLLYKKIRERIKGGTEAFAFICKAQDAASIYSGLQNPSDWEKSEDHSALNALSIFGVQQHFSLLLAAADKLPHQDFSRLLWWVEIISFRYNIVSDRRTGPLESAYNKAALAVRKGEGLAAVKEVLTEPGGIYVADEDFKNDFITLGIPVGNRRRNNLIRYIFAKLERQKSGQPVDLNSTTVTIEHILPQNPSEKWGDEFPNKTRDLYAARIGNYCLLSAAENRRGGDDSYSDKKPIYEKSGYALTREWLYDEWTPDNLSHRQRKMAEIAVHCWRIG